MGVLGGGAIYFGDVAPKQGIALETAHAAFGGYIKKELSNKFSLKGSALSTTLSGDDYLYTDDPYRIGRGYYFTTSVLEIALTPEWEPFRKTTSQRFSPRIFAGPAIFMIDPSPNFDRNKHGEHKEGIAIDKGTSLPNLFFGITGGIGFNLKLGANFYLNGSTGLRVPFTDYLDGISEAANPDQNDWYGVANLALGYRISRADDDRDGIANINDNCPQVPGSPKFNGCPDSDNDGIEDLVDDCPLAFGPPELHGCPDSDGDGIIDKNDSCPEEAGLPALDGCPFKDADGDGIEDRHDDCPMIAGVESRNGCPELDTDGDGVLDEDDNCPNIFGVDVFKGCPDTDGDGIEDSKDNCPNEFGLYENNGCPVVIIAADQAMELNSQHIYFVSGKYEPVSHAHLDAVAAFMKENRNYKLKLNGFSDSGGSKDQNKYVSRKRAKNCYNYLVRHGISSRRMSYHGYGEADPVASNKTKEGRSKNRRVEVLLYE